MALFAEDLANGLRGKVLDKSKSWGDLTSKQYSISQVAKHKWLNNGQSIRVGAPKELLAEFNPNDDPDEGVLDVVKMVYRIDRVDLPEDGDVCYMHYRIYVWPYRGLEDSGSPKVVASERRSYYTTVFNPMWERWQ